MASTGSNITLPAGVSVQGARESSQPDFSGTIVSGMVFTLRLPGGTTTSLFVPYDEMASPSVVEQAIANRVAQVQAIANAPTSGS